MQVEIDFTKNDDLGRSPSIADQSKIGEYRGWNLWLLQMTPLKVCATRGEFWDFTSPIIHAGCGQGTSEAVVGGIYKVCARIDDIEQQGFEVFMDETFPEWRDQ